MSMTSADLKSLLTLVYKLVFLSVGSLHGPLWSTRCGCVRHSV